MRYYVYPTPQRYLEAITAVASNGAINGQKVEVGFFDWLKPKNVPKILIDCWSKKTDASLISFVATLCTQNPSRVSAWLKELRRCRSVSRGPWGYAA